MFIPTQQIKSQTSNAKPQASTRTSTPPQTNALKRKYDTSTIVAAKSHAITENKRRLSTQKTSKPPTKPVASTKRTTISVLNRGFQYICPHCKKTFHRQKKISTKHNDEQMRPNIVPNVGAFQIPILFVFLANKKLENASALRA